MCGKGTFSQIRSHIVFLEQNDHNFQLYPFCFFQFYKSYKRGKGNQNPIVTIISTNIFSGSDIVTNINCRWYPNSLYYGQNPLTVYLKHIRFYTNESSVPLFTTGLLCHCTDKV